MNQWMAAVMIYLAAINVYAFAIMGIDKQKAKKGQWRISEKNLLGAAFIGGGLGAFLGMKAFHHKTKHKLFQWLVPIFLLMQIGILVYVGWGCVR